MVRVLQVHPDELTPAERQRVQTRPARAEISSAGDVRLPKNVLLRAPVALRRYAYLTEVTLRTTLEAGFYVVVPSCMYARRTRAYVLRILQAIV